MGAIMQTTSTTPAIVQMMRRMKFSLFSQKSSSHAGEREVEPYGNRQSKQVCPDNSIGSDAADQTCHLRPPDNGASVMRCSHLAILVTSAREVVDEGLCDCRGDRQRPGDVR